MKRKTIIGLVVGLSLAIAAAAIVVFVVWSRPDPTEFVRGFFDDAIHGRRSAVYEKLSGVAQDREVLAAQICEEGEAWRAIEVLSSGAEKKEVEGKSMWAVPFRIMESEGKTAFILVVKDDGKLRIYGFSDGDQHACFDGVIRYILTLPKDPQPFIDRGDEAFEAGDFKTAAREYSLAINYGAQDAEVFLRAGKAFFKLAEDAELPQVKRREYFSAGVRRVDQALQINPQFLEAQQLKTDLTWSMLITGARFRNEQPDWEKFIAEATKLIELDPENAVAYFRRGQGYMGLMHRDEGRYRELARADFAQAVALEPENISFLVDGQIALLLQAEQLDEAEAAYLAAIENNPQHPQLRVHYAKLLYRRDKKAESFGQIQMAIEVAQEQGPAERMVAQMALADYYYAEAQIEEAILAYEAAESIDPTDFRAYVMHTFLLKKQARYEESTGVMRKAMEVAEDLLAGEGESELSPDQRSRLELSLIDLRYRMADSLLDEIASAPDMDEETEASRIEEVDDHMTIIDSQQNIRPIEPRYYKILGRIALTRGDLDEAIMHLLQAYEDTKAYGGYDEHTARLLISLYARQDRLTNAEGMIDEYLRYPDLPNRKDVLLAKARVLMKYREYDKARAFVERALELDSDYKPAKDLLWELDILTE